MLESGPNTIVSDLLGQLDAALAAGDIERAVALFQADCYWRDLVAFTWNITTLEGHDQVRAMLTAQLAGVRPSEWRIADSEDATETDGVTECWISFETAVARGSGHLRLKQGRIWTLLTTMRELKGHEERLGLHRPMGARHGAEPGRRSWQDERDAERAELGVSRQPYCLIVGGGQGGMALGARLRQLGVPTLIVDRNERPGDSWRKRYKTLCLHDPVWYDHLPYLPFPRNWPVFAPKDKIADWLAMYADVMELNFWGRTECKSARFDEATGEWTVVVSRDGADITLHPNAARPRDRDGRQAQRSTVQGRRHLQGRAAPFVGTSRARELPRQESRRRRLEQFGARHLCRAVGGRSRSHHDPALVDARRALRLAHGVRPGQLVLRTCG